VSPDLGQLWEDTNYTPALLKMWDGTVWEPSLSAGVFPTGVIKTANFTVDADKRLYLVDCTSGPVTATMLTAVGRGGKEYAFKKIDATPNALILDGAGTETIDGATTIDTATPGDAVVIESDNVGWRITTSPTGVTGMEERTTDPGTPIDGQQWIRGDLSPPELRYHKGATTYKLTFTTV
jgi:hypothetical protein